jgi:spore coat protein U-like protein
MPRGIGRAVLSARSEFVMRTVKFFVLALAACTGAGAAYADDDTDSLTVSATVLATCEVTANDLDFGDYDPLASSHLDAATTLSVTCTNGTPYNIALDLGIGLGATTAARVMVDGGDTLNYTLYRNSTRTQLWGETIGTDTLSGVGSGNAATIDVFGRVPMLQQAPSGDYEDTITVKVTW